MNKKQLSAAAGILSMNLLLMSTAAVGAAIAAIAKSFPTEPISKVQMVGSIPQLGQILATLLFSWLAFKFTRKNLGLVSVGIVTVSGLIPVFYASSLNLILACMVLVGFGTGIISNVGPVLMQEHFDGEERATVMGWSTGVSNIGMMVFTALGGVLGGSNWRNLFWVYAVGVVIFLMGFFMIPKEVKTARAESAEKSDTSEKTGVFKTMAGLNGYTWIIYLITFVTSMVMMTFMSNQSILLSGYGKGTTYTAIVVTLGNVGGIVTALVLTYIRKLTKEDTIAWGFVAGLLSFACIMFSSNVVLHVLGNMFSGMSIVMINATIPYELSILADRKHFTVAISLNTLISSIAGLIVPMLLALVHIQPGFNSFLFGVILCVVMFAVLMVTRFGNRVKAKSE